MFIKNRILVLAIIIFDEFCEYGHGFDEDFLAFVGVFLTKISLEALDLATQAEMLSENLGSCNSTTSHYFNIRMKNYVMKIYPL